MSGGPAGQRWFIVLSPDGAARMVSLHCAKAFEERFGADCKTFDSLKYRNAFSQLQNTVNHEMTVDLLNQSLIVSCLDFSATHILVMALSPVTVFSLNLLRKQGVKTIHWFFEDFRRVTYWKEVLPGYDHFCAIQRGPLPDACRATGAAYHFLPTAASMVSAGPISVSDRPYDVGFIGIPTPYRIAVLELLAQNGMKVAIAGSGWNVYGGILQKSIIKSTWVSEEESFNILCRSKTGINLSVDKPVDRTITHISPRVYDILLAGCSLVSENVTLLEETLPDCRYYTFNSPDDAFLAVDKALSEHPALFTTAEKNRLMIIQNHTYKQRVEQICRICGTD